MTLQIFVSKNYIMCEFFDTNHLQCSNNFATDCIKVIGFLKFFGLNFNLKLKEEKMILN